ncbi:hypothetical protein H0H81_012542 [Sphagnurus paluster]|uniref:Uncharacterized protein n=1 Tax=Sphagnurus paluster TaxID=117069 RepID=A0A9P7GN39_9AGAR|nr:hypothetical protein H0H81_012542 [Sphagnurus paluster]
MKYSQAILIACIGAATLVSADLDATKQNPSGTEFTPPTLQRAKPITDGLRRPSRSEYLKSRIRSSWRTNPYENRANTQSPESDINSPPFSPSTPSGPPHTTKPNSGERSHGRKRKQPMERQFSTRELDLDVELSRRMFDRFKSNSRKAYEQEKKATKSRQKAAKADALAGVYKTDFRQSGGTAASSGAEGGLGLRELEDDLFVRGFIQKLKSNYLLRQADELEKDAAKKKALAGVELGTRAFDDEDMLLSRDADEALFARQGTTEETILGRDFEEDSAFARDITEDVLSAREISSEDAPFNRDFDEDLYVRELSEEDLSARDFDEDLYAREPLEEGELFGREVEDILYSREPLEELFGREFDDELFLRAVDEELATRDPSATIVNIWGAIRDTFAGRKTPDATSNQRASPATTSTPAPASNPVPGGNAPVLTGDEQLNGRDLDDEVEMRDFYEIDELD